jgi:threonylcarbamoyladenosine tRNA methylthiotransferase MtaB
LTAPPDRGSRIMRVAFTTLGCKANWCDTEAMSQAVACAGMEVVPFEGDADIYIVNTCAVTALAEAQSRQMLRRARRRSARSIVVAAGCAAGRSRGQLASACGADAAFGAMEREALLAYIFEGAGVRGVDDGRGGFGLTPASQQSRARAFIKIQDGCDRRCAFCIVPALRGGTRSLPPGDVVRIAGGLSRHHREIVLAGIDIGQYGRDLPGAPTLMGLVDGLVSLPGMARLRLSSLDPRSVDGAIAGLMAQGRLCRHAHISMQSGSDRVLRMMGRGYRAGQLRSAAELVSGSSPHAAVTGDVIAGFPGETDEDHRETVELLSALPIAGLHVFPFSAREGTAAARMPGEVPHATRRARSEEIRALARRKRRDFLEGLIGSSFDVIVTSRAGAEDGTVAAFADNAVSMRVPSGRVPYGGIGRARVAEAVDLEVRGVWE